MFRDYHIFTILELNINIFIIKKKVILELFKLLCVAHRFLESLGLSVLTDNFGTYIEHIANNSAQKAAFTRSNTSYDTNKLSLLDFEVNFFQSYKLPKCLNVLLLRSSVLDVFINEWLLEFGVNFLVRGVFFLIFLCLFFNSPAEALVLNLDGIFIVLFYFYQFIDIDFFLA